MDPDHFVALRKLLKALIWILGAGLVLSLLLSVVFGVSPGIQNFAYASLGYGLRIALRSQAHYDEWTADATPKLIRVRGTKDIHVHGILAGFEIAGVSSAVGPIRIILPPPDFQIEWLLFAARRTGETYMYPYRPVELRVGVPPADGTGIVVKLGEQSASKCYWYMHQKGGSVPFIGEMPSFQVVRDTLFGNCLPNNAMAYLSPYPLRVGESLQIPMGIFVDRRFPGTYEVDVSLGYVVSVGQRQFKRLWPQSKEDKLSAHFTIVYNPNAEVPQNPDPSRYSNEEWRRQWLADDEDRRRKAGDVPPPCLHSSKCFELEGGQAGLALFSYGSGWPGAHFVAPELPIPTPITPFPLRPGDKLPKPPVEVPKPSIEPSPSPFPLGPPQPRPPVPILPTPLPRPLPPFPIP